jgi:hypothetical protein
MYGISRIFRLLLTIPIDEAQHCENTSSSDHGQIIPHDDLKSDGSVFHGVKSSNRNTNRRTLMRKVGIETILEILNKTEIHPK